MEQITNTKGTCGCTQHKQRQQVCPKNVCIVCEIPYRSPTRACSMRMQVENSQSIWHRCCSFTKKKCAHITRDFNNCAVADVLLCEWLCFSVRLVWLISSPSSSVVCFTLMDSKPCTGIGTHFAFHLSTFFPVLLLSITASLSLSLTLSNCAKESTFCETHRWFGHLIYWTALRVFSYIFFFGLEWGDKKASAC